MSQVFEVQCKACQSIFDLDQDPSVSNFTCPCISKEGSTVFKNYFITCSVNRRHHYWSNRSEDCKFCLDETENKRALITIKHEGIKINGQSVPLTFEKPQTPISPDQIKQIMVSNSEQEKKDRDLKIISLLEQLVKQNQEPEIIANELRDDK